MTITERCADPAFQRLLKRAHPLLWASGERQELPAHAIAETIVADVICGGEPGENHPEFRALVSALERTQIADL